MKRTYLKLLLLTVIAFSFAACDNTDDPIDQYQNSTQRLCANTWIDTYTTTDHYYITHELIFDANGQGLETFITNNLDVNGNIINPPAKTENNSFAWKWDNSNMESITLDFGGSSFVYFDNVWVRNDFLSGKFDGVIVSFANASL